MAPCEALALRRARHVNELAFDKVVGDDLGADVDHVVRLTRNSTTLRFGSTLATGELPRSALVT
jgi:hypothetical protein